MAIGSGLSAFIGYAAESVYGTYVAPTKFVEFDKEDLKKVKTTVQGGGLASGRLLDLGTRRVFATEAAAGTIDLEVPTAGGFGLLLSHLMGSSAIAQQGATTAWLQTHTFADNVGKFLSVQKGVPGTSGTVTPYSFTGGKITSAEFSCDVNSALTASFGFDFQKVVDSQTLATPSYTAGVSIFHGGQMNVKLGTYSSEAAISGITKVSVKIERPQATDRFYAQGAGSPGTKLEPLMNDMVKITGTLDADFVTKADLADRFASDASTALVIEWVGPIIASTFKQTFRIKVPMIFVDSDTPTVGGPDVVSGSFGFTGQYDGTNAPAIIEYMSTDTAY